MNRREFLTDFTTPPTPPVQAAEGDKGLKPLVSGEATNFGGEAKIVPTAGSPRQYKRGDMALVLDAKAWLGCDEIGFYAIDALCPHLGCLTQQTAEGLACPGHGSRFDHHGARLGSPARHNLRYLYVDLDAQGNLIIVRGKPTSSADRLIA